MPNKRSAKPSRVPSSRSPGPHYAAGDYERGYGSGNPEEAGYEPETFEHQGGYAFGEETRAGGREFGKWNPRDRQPRRGDYGYPFQGDYSQRTIVPRERNNHDGNYNFKAGPPQSSFGQDDRDRGNYSYEGVENSGYGGVGGRRGESEPSGNFRGRGPKGYKRSAARIEEDVCEALTNHPAVDAENIEVSVEEGGVVVLKGNVPTRYMKRLSEECVDAVSGVTDVRNELRLGSTPKSEGLAN